VSEDREAQIARGAIGWVGLILTTVVLGSLYRWEAGLGWLGIMLLLDVQHNGKIPL